MEEEQEIKETGETMPENSVEGIQSLLTNLKSTVDTNPAEAIFKLCDVVAGLVVVTSQLGEVAKTHAGALDELEDVLENGVLGPFAKAAHTREIDEIKEKLTGEGHNFGEYSQRYFDIYDTDLLEETAEKLHQVREEAAAAGETFDEEAWIGNEFEALKAKFEKMGLAPAAAAEKAEEVVEANAEAAEEAPAQAAAGDIDDEVIRATLEKLTI